MQGMGMGEVTDMLGAFKVRLESWDLQSSSNSSQPEPPACP